MSGIPLAPLQLGLQKGTRCNRGQYYFKPYMPNFCAKDTEFRSPIRACVSCLHCTKHAHRRYYIGIDKLRHTITIQRDYTNSSEFNCGVIHELKLFHIPQMALRFYSNSCITHKKLMIFTSSFDRPLPPPLSLLPPLVTTSAFFASFSWGAVANSLSTCWMFSTYPRH